MCMATALQHALEHDLKHAAHREPGQRDQLRHNACLSVEIGSGSSSGLLSAALARCRHLLMLAAPSESLPQKDARVDGYEVVGLMSLASSAMRTMLTLASQDSEPPAALVQVYCVQASSDASRACVRIADPCVTAVPKAANVHMRRQRW